MSVELGIHSNRYLRATGEELEEYRRRIRAHSSWETMYKILDVRTSSNERQHSLLDVNKALLKDYYEAWFRVVTGRGYRTLAKFNEQNFTDENLARMRKLNPHLNMIRSALVRPNPEPYSHLTIRR